MGYDRRHVYALAMALALAVVGLAGVLFGIGTIEGPIVGVIVYFLLREYLADYGAIYMIAFGVLAITIMLTLKGGIWGTLRRYFGVQLFPVQRRVLTKSSASGS